MPLHAGQPLAQNFDGMKTTDGLDYIAASLEQRVVSCTNSASADAWRRIFQLASTGASLSDRQETCVDLFADCHCMRSSPTLMIDTELLAPPPKKSSSSSRDEAAAASAATISP